MNDEKPEEQNGHCEFFYQYKDNDSKIFYLNGILLCGNKQCPYGHFVGMGMRYEGENPILFECGTGGLKEAKKLEETVEAQIAVA